MRRGFHRAVLALGLAQMVLAPVGPARAETVSLTVPQARAVARDAYRAGDFVLAYSMAQGLLARDPQDPAALLLVAASAPALGLPAEARRAGRLAFRLAPTPGMKYEAARYTAGAAVAEGRLGLAQYWLRRAEGLAPTPQHAARTVQDFRLVRSRNPVQLSFSFSVAPSSNLNNGADSAYDLTDGVVGFLSGSSRALSGVRASTAITVMRRVRESATSKTEIGARVFGTINWLSREARDLIRQDVARGLPDLTGSDLNYTLAEAILRQSWLFEGARTPVVLTLGAGQSWYGGERYAEQLRFSVAKSYYLSDRDRMALTFSGDRQQPERRALVTAFGFSADYSRALANGNQLSLGVSLRDTQSADVNSDYRSASLQLGYEFGQPIGPVAVSARLAVGWRDYAAYDMGLFMVEGGRQDRIMEIGIDMALPEAAVAGFAPVLSLEAQRTDSNVGRFDARELNVSLGFRSLF